jgi:stress-induced morphogen
VTCDKQPQTVTQLVPSMFRRSIMLNARRSFGTSPKEVAMEKRLLDELKATSAIVTDVSGGCGSFFNIKVVSPLFEGKTPVARNRLVHAALKEEIGEMHGLNIECLVRN